MTGHLEPPRGEILWRPSAERLQTAAFTHYRHWLEQRLGVAFDSYQAVWEWSVTDLSGFWDSVWEYFDVIGARSGGEVLRDRGMPDVEWFPGTYVNYAENALRHQGADPAIVAWNEFEPETVVSRDQLRQEVAEVAAGLRQLGIGKGDVVAAYLPNIPVATVAMLATVSLGAIWSCCSPDFGTSAVLDRFRQVDPKLLIAVDGYTYRGKSYERRDVVEALSRALPHVSTTVWVANLGLAAPAGALAWQELRKGGEPLSFERVPFEHPLWVLYSSGTTGLPKPIVHGHGGIVLEHFKNMALQSNIVDGSRYFQYTTTGWMMWNTLMGGLLVGATIYLFDGAADYPDFAELWRQTAKHGINSLGSSAAFISACMKRDMNPSRDFDLSELRALSSTGSPLPDDGFRWVYEAVGKDVHLRSNSGGTDVCCPLLTSCPVLPVRAGELQCRPLGVASAAFGKDGKEVFGQVGELVVQRPMPSMPVALWGDGDGSRLLASYYTQIPGVWRHGDWVTVFRDGSSIVHGRSDATLNRGGTRIGTAELYRAVEALDTVADCVAVEIPTERTATQILLLVVPAAGVLGDAALRESILRTLREQLSPRHVPDVILWVADLPKTLNGKKLEIPIKRILMGSRIDESVSVDSVANPSSLLLIEALSNDAWQHQQ